jgi:WD40 repeat protein
VAIGGNDGILRVYKCIDGTDQSKSSDNINCILIDPRQTLSSEPYREYKNNGHSKDIFDISWGASSPSSNLVLTASSDFTVFIYNIGLNGGMSSQFHDKPIQILKHPDIVSAAAFKIGVITTLLL